MKEEDLLAPSYYTNYFSFHSLQYEWGDVQIFPRGALFGVLQEFKHGMSKNWAGKEALILPTLLHMCILAYVGISWTEMGVLTWIELCMCISVWTLNCKVHGREVICRFYSRCCSKFCPQKNINRHTMKQLSKRLHDAANKTSLQHAGSWSHLAK